MGQVGSVPYTEAIPNIRFSLPGPFYCSFNRSKVGKSPNYDAPAVVLVLISVGGSSNLAYSLLWTCHPC
jgi:hypothetical protein